MATASSATERRSSILVGRNSLLDRYFYFVMSLIFAGLVIEGFGPTLAEKLVHPVVAPPTILWYHGVVFSAWLIFYILQSALVRTRNVSFHRTIGWAGAALVVIMLPLGLATGVQMVHFEIYQLHMQNRWSFLAVPFFDVGSFALCIALAIWWRKKPKLHRRLVYFGTSALLVAAFARLDHAYMRAHSNFYLGADALIVLAMIRDQLVNGRVHKVYRVGLPIYIVAQITVVYLWRGGPDWWVNLCRSIIG
jgi:hypothetical protein